MIWSIKQHKLVTCLTVSSLSMLLLLLFSYYYSVDSIHRRGLQKASSATLILLKITLELRESSRNI